MDYMKKAATHLARQGRGPDTTLMHVTDREAGILGLLHPDGRLPRNPSTGLPEAGWFDTILPMAVGLGVTALTGGAAAPYALMYGAGASGATKAAMTGDLKQGIMTGLLSYGAGSALQGLSGGAEAAGAAGSGGVGVAGSAPMTMQGVTPDMSGIFGGSGQLTMPSAADLANIAPSTSAMSAPAVVPEAVVPAAVSPPPITPPSLGTGLQRLQNIPTDTMSQFSKIGENLSTDPAGTLGRTFIDNPMKTTLPLAAGLYGTMYGNPEPLNVPKELTKEELERKYPEQFPDPRTVVSPPAGYNPGVDPEFNYFRYGMAEGGQVLMGNHDALYKEGGIASANPGAATKANIEAEAKMALLGEHPRAEEALARYQKAFGEEAMNDLMGRVRPPGGRIRGAGGGLDDLIPGTIEGRKQVRLADGEFVVPADVVGHLGDGSTDQGVRKLYEMMDRVRHSKTGSKKQPGPVKDRKVLPV
jgi:hypothetical protein